MSMTNREWLYSLDVADLADWFDAEHVEHGSVQREIAELQAQVEELTAERDQMKADYAIVCIDYRNACRERDKFKARVDELEARNAKLEHRLNMELACSDKSIAEALQARVDELERELRVKCDEHDEAERDWERKFNEAMGKEYSIRKELIAELDELRAGEWAKADNAIRELSEENDELRVERDALVDALGATDAIEWSQEQLENANPALINALKVHDTREKLEADVRDFVDYNGWFDDNGWSTAIQRVDCKPTIKELFISWLDRQAAITERRYRELTGAFQLESDKRIAELQGQVDELREKLSRAIGNAHDTISLVDLEGNVL